ncbi:MAG: cytochrome C oxidase subunit IV family protein [Bacteroidia bacterium]|nr:cytochrome C oxidase subunit IV family protein [Bacteroidia bacterium]
MEQEHQHITSYRTYAIVLTVLLFLTALTVYVTWFDFEALTIVVAMAIASVKVTIVISYFMHIKHDKLVFKLMVGVVFLLILVIFLILFSDYLFR